MKDEKRNLGASVAARLLNQNRKTGGDYQTLLEAFCYERFLYRLGASEARERFVLKGAMLLRLWSDQPYRATRDLDLLRKGDGSFEAIRADVKSICEKKVDADGVEFDPESIEVQAIRVEDEYGGARVNLNAVCDTARLRLQIDMGVGDSIWPLPRPIAYPTLLDMPAPSIFAYPPEAVVAEKLEAIVVLGDRNSRIKDYFDLQYLAGRFAFDRTTLAEAIRRTFARRATPVPTEAPIGLTRGYWENPSRPPQIRAFARRAHLTVGPDPGDEILGAVRPFLLPVLEDVRSGAPTSGSWAPGGPWR